jgi:Tol biopolymer transport system component
VILPSGTTIGSYRIVAPLGRGGMGEVYRARDERLGRDAAIKVLREEDAEDPELLVRFEREARAASSLNHPNIVVVYEAGTASVPGRESPVHYLAMELIDGEPMAAALGGDPMPLRRFLDLAAQLADGIARAHESGIVHRDLKPSNVFVTSEGRVKILDFGLAALHHVPAGDDTQSPTAAGRLTSPGMALGTLGYMSPEQARGEAATPASDQFSMGCIFYEMLTGKPAFSRPSSAETFSAILRDDPPPADEINPAVTQPLRWILERCLAKAPRDRYASSRDLARDLQTIKDHSTTTGFRAAAAASERPGRLLPWITAGALALAVGVAGGVVLLGRLRAPLQPGFRRLTFREGIVTRALFAPNGSILYAASWEGNPVRSYLALPESTGIDRVLESDMQFPLGFSEDGSQVLVLVGPSRLSVSESGTLAWWPALGGRPRRILDSAGWADAARSGRFLAVVRDLGAERVLEIRGSEGALQRTLFRTPGAIWFARISPDERKVAFIHYPFRGDNTGEIEVASVDGSGSKPLTRRFNRCDGLDWSAKTGELWFSASTEAAYGSALFTVSPSGRLHSRYVLPDYFTLQSVSASGDRFLLTSKQEGIGLTARRGAEDAHDLSWLGWTLIRDISPDGKTALFYDRGPTEKTTGIWIRPLEGGDATRLGEGFPGKFSPDGRAIVAVTRPASGPPQLVLIPVEAGDVRRLSIPGGDVSAPSFAGPGRLLFVHTEKGSSEVWTMETDGSGSKSLGATGCDAPAASPSGREFLCLQGERQRSLVVYPIHGGQGRRLFELPSDRDFVYARWNAAGDRIFGVTRDRRLLTLDSSTGAIVRDEAIGLSATTGRDRLISAALDAEGQTRLYSTIRASSDLYLATGIR